MKLLFLLVMQPTNQYPSQHWWGLAKKRLEGMDQV
jgi:hypothetical protein